jgi:hypothetical protein
MSEVEVKKKGDYVLIPLPMWNRTVKLLKKAYRLLEKLDKTESGR